MRIDISTLTPTYNNVPTITMVSKKPIPNSKKELGAQHHDFMSVVHIFETNPQLSKRSLPDLYRSHQIFIPAAHHETESNAVSNHYLMGYIRQQRKLGVLINYAWPNIQYDPIKWGHKLNCLAQYCGFSGNEEMTAYADTIG